MIHRELAMHHMAYNLVRLTMLEAAAQKHLPVETLSFKAALTALREWAHFFCALPRRARESPWSRLLDLLAGDTLPHRPNRVEPRARKRRRKNYQLLTKPRRQFKGIPLRSKYRKSLS